MIAAGISVRAPVPIQQKPDLYNAWKNKAPAIKSTGGDKTPSGKLRRLESSRGDQRVQARARTSAGPQKAVPN